MQSEELRRLQDILNESGNIVFFGGAGVSTESGIPDFRSESGVFQALERYGHPPETLLSRAFFFAQPDVFYGYYKELLVRPTAKPNPAHYALAKLEGEGRVKAIITQNIDGLHQRAGSQNVLELHGSMERNYCCACKKEYSLAHILESEGVPRCTCGGMVRPDVVLYGEALREEILSASTSHIRRAETLLIGGTSLAVYPAAGLLTYFRGKHLVLINKSATAMDEQAELVIRAPIGEVLRACVI